MLKIEFRTDTDAFRGGSTDDDALICRTHECAGVLERILKRVRGGWQEGLAVDRHGKQVGTWAITED